MHVIHSLNGLYQSNSWKGLPNYVLANIWDFITFSGTIEVNLLRMKKKTIHKTLEEVYLVTAP